MLTEPDLDIDSNIDIKPKVMKDVACGDEPDQIDKELMSALMEYQ